MLKELTTIQPDQWKSLGNVLKPINNQGSINIRNSKICQDINNGVAVLTADIKNLIGSDINLDVMSPSKHIKLFKLLEGDEDVDIYDDDDNSQYVITNGHIRIYLPKQIETINPEKPDYDNLDTVGELIKLDKDNKKEIETIIKAETVDSIDLLIKNEQLMGFEVIGTGVYLFPNYTNESNLNNQTADLVLKSYAFMIIPGEEFDIALGRDKDNRDNYLLITGINTGITTIRLHEDVNEGGVSDGLDLI